MKGNKDKLKVRSTKAWKEWRLKCFEAANGRDYVTGKKLYKGWNLHHLDESLENYAVFTDDRFLPVNKKTHDMIEWLWVYYRKDPEVIERLKSVMERMVAYQLEHDLHGGEGSPS